MQWLNHEVSTITVVLKDEVLKTSCICPITLKTFFVFKLVILLNLFKMRSRLCHEMRSFKPLLCNRIL